MNFKKLIGYVMIYTALFLMGMLLYYAYNVWVLLA